MLSTVLTMLAPPTAAYLYMPSQPLYLYEPALSPFAAFGGGAYNPGLLTSNGLLSSLDPFVRHPLARRFPTRRPAIDALLDQSVSALDALVERAQQRGRPEFGGSALDALVERARPGLSGMGWRCNNDKVEATLALPRSEGGTITAELDGDALTVRSRSERDGTTMEASRTLVLPHSVAADTISLVHDEAQGTVTISIPKPEERSPTPLAIETAPPPPAEPAEPASAEQQELELDEKFGKMSLAVATDSATDAPDTSAEAPVEKEGNAGGEDPADEKQTAEEEQAAGEEPAGEADRSAVKV